MIWSTMKPRHCPDCDERRRDLAEALATIERLRGALREIDKVERNRLYQSCPDCEHGCDHGAAHDPILDVTHKVLATTPPSGACRHCGIYHPATLLDGCRYEAPTSEPATKDRFAALIDPLRENAPEVDEDAPLPREFLEGLADETTEDEPAPCSACARLAPVVEAVQRMERLMQKDLPPGSKEYDDWRAAVLEVGDRIAHAARTAGLVAEGESDG